MFWDNFPYPITRPVSFAVLPIEPEVQAESENSTSSDSGSVTGASVIDSDDDIAIPTEDTQVEQSINQEDSRST